MLLSGKGTVNSNEFELKASSGVCLPLLDSPGHMVSCEWALHFHLMKHQPSEYNAQGKKQSAGMVPR